MVKKNKSFRSTHRIRMDPSLREINRRRIFHQMGRDHVFYEGGEYIGERTIQTRHGNRTMPIWGNRRNHQMLSNSNEIIQAPSRNIIEEEPVHHPMGENAPMTWENFHEMAQALHNPEPVREGVNLIQPDTPAGERWHPPTGLGGQIQMHGLQNGAAVALQRSQNNELRQWQLDNLPENRRWRVQHAPTVSASMQLNMNQMLAMYPERRQMIMETLPTQIAARRRAERERNLKKI